MHHTRIGVYRNGATGRAAKVREEMESRQGIYMSSPSVMISKIGEYSKIHAAATQRKTLT